MASSLKLQANACMTFMFQSQTKRKLETMFHLFNVFAVLFLLSRSSLLPITLHAFSHSLSLLLSLFNNPFCAFLLLNSIILSLYALSNITGNSGNSKDLYDEFLSNGKTTAHVPINIIPKESTPEKQSVTALDSSDNNKPVVSTEPNPEAGESSVLNGTVTAVTTHETTTCCTTTSGDQVSQKRSYRRVQSESFERRVVVAGSGPQLRRMNTGLSRQRQRRLCHVEQLNKEEFNRAVEDFIAKQKRMLWEEQRESNKTEYLAAF